MVVSYPTMSDGTKRAEAVLMGSLFLHPEEGTPVQAIQRQELPKFVPKIPSHQRELPQGYVLDEMEADNESEPDATISSVVNEQEQNLG